MALLFRDICVPFNERRVILMYTLTFNSKTSAYASTKSEENLLFIRCQENYFNSVLRVRGYLYMNTIYEMLGVEWNTDFENFCIMYKPNNTSLKLAIRCVNEDGYDIDIL